MSNLQILHLSDLHFTSKNNYDLSIVTNALFEDMRVDWEINESIKLGKAVIAVYQGDTPPKRIPPALEKINVKPTQWSAKGIMSAIEKACKNRK